MKDAVHEADAGRFVGVLVGEFDVDFPDSAFKGRFAGALEADEEFLHVVVYEGYFVVGHEPVGFGEERGLVFLVGVIEIGRIDLEGGRVVVWETYIFMTSVSMRRLGLLIFPDSLLECRVISLLLLLSIF